MKVRTGRNKECSSSKHFLQIQQENSERLAISSLLTFMLIILTLPYHSQCYYQGFYHKDIFTRWSHQNHAHLVLNSVQSTSGWTFICRPSIFPLVCRYIHFFLVERMLQCMFINYLFHEHQSLSIYLRQSSFSQEKILKKSIPIFCKRKQILFF